MIDTLFHMCNISNQTQKRWDCLAALIITHKNHGIYDSRGRAVIVAGGGQCIHDFLMANITCFMSILW